MGQCNGDFLRANDAASGGEQGKSRQQNQATQHQAFPLFGHETRTTILAETPHPYCIFHKA
jgi:hypothetical protein